MPDNALLAERLTALRKEMTKRDLDGFLVPLADEHQGEYVPARARRLAWLTGFTGSAGLAIVTADSAAIFVDGRYTLQVTNESDGELYRFLSSATDPEGNWPPAGWIESNLPKNGKLGFDPWLHTDSEIERLKKICGKGSGALLPCDTNPIDAIWPDQPAPPLAPISPHAENFAGIASATKRAEMGEKLKEMSVDAVVLSAPDSIAWLLNIRGNDVPYSPLPLAFAIADRSGGVDLFVDSRKVTPELSDHLGDSVKLRAPNELGLALDQLASENKRTLISKGSTPHWISARLRMGGGVVRYGEDPCALPKARKNETELAGAKAAHLRDGVALVHFFHWLDEATKAGSIDEMGAAAKLETFRSKNDLFQGLSFPTISGAGPNGAIVHYSVDEASNRPLEMGSLYLVDSGGQYLDGTTDVTRTVAIGKPTLEMRERFTLVLKGHIGVASAVFPPGTTGAQLDILARQALWKVGLDYEHGTGHGVGSYLSVHEGPHRISKAPSNVALESGMIVSNEPGYYKAGEYGIRIENLITVEAIQAQAGSERNMLRFSTLTLAPIDLALIDRALLNPDEIDWLNRYHAEVRTALSSHLSADARHWLELATKAM